MFNKLFFTSFKFTLLSLALIIIGGSSKNVKFVENSYAQYRFPATDNAITRTTAYRNWFDLAEDRRFLRDRELKVVGRNMPITYGGEKEGSSTMITRVMGPSSNQFQEAVEELDSTKRNSFLKNFLGNWKKDGTDSYRTYKKEGQRIDLANDVLTLSEDNPKIDMSIFDGIDIERANITQLEDLFEKWLAQTNNNPFSFIKPTTRRKIFGGNLPGLKKQWALDEFFDSSSKWVPLLGDSEKYLIGAHRTGAANGYGWEVNFKPQKSYGAFERMVAWFKKSLSIKDLSSGKVKLFQSLGHQWIVMPNPTNLNKKKLYETLKIIQALIVVEGIKGRTNIEYAHHKTIHSDEDIMYGQAERGVIRFMNGNSSPFNVENSTALELRAGTKDPRVQQFIHQVISSRMANNDWSGIIEGDKYTLIDTDFLYDLAYREESEIRKLSDLFEVTENQMKKAMERIQSSGVKKEFLIPFWGWYDKLNPIVGTNKQEILKKLTNELILEIGKLPQNGQTQKHIYNLIRGWVKGTKLAEDMRKYLMPIPRKLAADFHKVPVSRSRGAVDVNKIDLGIEFSAKMPIKSINKLTTTPLEDDKKHWMQTTIDLLPEERDELIKNMAKELSVKLGGNGQTTHLSDDGHGHGLDIAYEIKDSEQRKWRVEWDGIQRSYKPNGDLVQGSVHGGSIELVTPKFNPTTKELDSVFEIFNKFNVIPSLKSGGGHVNIDLAPFKNKPAKLARFLSIFHQYRGVIALMFQKAGRLKSAEPVDITDEFARSLANFSGSEEELKKLLYNNRYFSTRVGRKTRYIQLDVSSYFQDVIPEEFITEDFDISSTTTPWRRQFRVDPKIRKAEFRMMDAPQNAFESALQMKLVRAMLDKSFNSNASLDGLLQKVDLDDYLENPEKAFTDVESMCDFLGLNEKEYRLMVNQGLDWYEAYKKSSFFRALPDKFSMNPKTDGWKQAVSKRSNAQAIGSEGRVWSGRADTPSRNLMLTKKEAAKKAERARRAFPQASTGEFKRSACFAAMSRLVNN